jgi:anti-sigma regulatory factor (Ser/Thr protein kinase)
MDTMVPTRAAVRSPRRFSLAATPAAAAQARGHVQAAICAWEVPVDQPVAALLTSELVTNAIMHGPSQTVALVISCGRHELRVNVHDTSQSAPALVDAPVDAEAGRGLMLVANLSTDWGFYRTPAGKVVYFTLAFSDDLDESADRNTRSSRGQIQ